MEMSGQIYVQPVYLYLRFVAIRCVQLTNVQYISDERFVRTSVMHRVTQCREFQGDQNVSVHLMIKIQKDTSNVQIAPPPILQTFIDTPCYNEHGLREHSSTCQ
jgi:hypothetical protein